MVNSMEERVLQGTFCERLLLEEGGFQPVRLRFAPYSKGTFYICLRADAMEATLELWGEDGCAVNVFVDVRVQQRLTLKQQAVAAPDALLKISYLDLANAPADYDLHAGFMGQGAQLEIRSATLVEAAKTWKMEIVHDYPHTFGYMENYCVVKEQAKCQVEATGNIKKGAYGSESHQKTRVLTMQDRHHAEVVPVLYIDENDVKASHAMTLGQPDARQLYYLQTRGLSKEQALGLLCIGYFMPLVEQLAHTGLQDEIQCRVEEKVGLYGVNEQHSG